MDGAKQETLIRDYLESATLKKIIIGRLAETGLIVCDQGSKLGNKSNECLVLSLFRLFEICEIHKNIVTYSHLSRFTQIHLI